MKHTLRTVTLLSLLALILAVVTACATTPVSFVSPVLTWPGDSADTAAISWSVDGEAQELEVEFPDGSVQTVDAETERGFATATLAGLEPETEYRYRIAGGSWHRFTTAPESADTFSFAVIGDLQPFNAETIRTTSLVMDTVASLEPRFAVQVGDVSEVGISARSWRTALSVLSRLGAETPLVVAAGNHDYYYGLRSARYFKSIFRAPYPERNPRKHTWYSTTYGSVHISVLDTEADRAAFDAQISWLAEDLRQARDAGARWLFLVMHRPILTVGINSEDRKWATALFPLIADYGVTAVFWGHDHFFDHREYTYGGNGLVLNPGDEPAAQPVHLFTVGTAGARVDSLYPGFFTHRPFQERRQFYSAQTGEPMERVFVQHPWSRERVKYTGEGVRFQDRSEYPDAGSFYLYPFDSAADEAARRYATDPAVNYGEDSEFFGYTYGETSIHYLWVTVSPERCIISAHYADGEAGEHGTVITTPGGVEMRWEVPIWEPVPSP